MQTFTARYSNGQSSRLYAAEISFRPQALLITYTDDYGTQQTRLWHLNEINTDRFGYSFEYKLTYGKFPFESIEVDEAFFNSFHAQYPQIKLSNRNIEIIRRKTWRTIAVAFTVVAVFCSLVYFFVIPAVADSVAMAIPVSVETQLGEKIYRQNMLPFTVEDEQTKLVNDYYAQLGVESEYPVQITVVNYDEVNAFAMPGGHIVVFSGMLDRMNRHEELAGVLAHEYAHIHYRHSLRTIVRSLANYAIISIVIGDVSGISGLILENADNLRALQYSRELEKQADEYAFSLLREKGINPQGMIWLFETLQRLQEHSEINVTIPEFMSSHPDTKNRIEAMKMLLETEPFTPASDDELQVIWGKIKR
ncbi:MAG: M48 family metallopeptidase [Prevotellaceae bacterium]|jgi:predicted Zn-dependent protease|nr:M48 family metallopeptidase [Prevotellaceae bacterium]